LGKLSTCLLILYFEYIFVHSKRPLSICEAPPLPSAMGYRRPFHWLWMLYHCRRLC